MNLISDISSAEWISIGARIVGATFLWTAVIKAIAPHIFYQHLSALGWIPYRFLWPAVIASAAFEAGWGVALIAGLSPEWLLPATILLLAGFSVISWWGVRSGKTEDCGCYGGYIQPSIAQSLGLNAVFAALILLSWFVPVTPSPAALWQIVVTIVAALVVGGLAETARRYPDKHGRPMFDSNPIKVGRQWRHSWAGGATADTGDEVLVAYLGPDCPYCKSFVTIANAMVQSPKLPAVVGVVASTRARLDAFIEEKGIRFPMTIVSQSLMRRVAQAVPTAVLVKAGRIERIWVGAMPVDFVDRFRRAFFPDSVAGTTDLSAGKDGPLATSA